MSYAILKAIHLLSLIAWLGGMFFVLACLRPALGALDAPQRLRLMNAVLGRFLAVVGLAIVLILLSGGAMFAAASRESRGAGLGFNLPLDWLAMLLLGAVMILIYGHIRAVLYRRLQRALAAQDAAGGASALQAIRRWVGVNLALGVAIVLVMRLGAAA